MEMWSRKQAGKNTFAYLSFFGYKCWLLAVSYNISISQKDNVPPGAPSRRSAIPAQVVWHFSTGISTHPALLSPFAGRKKADFCKWHSRVTSICFWEREREPGVCMSLRTSLTKLFCLLSPAAQFCVLCSLCSVLQDVKT